MSAEEIAPEPGPSLLSAALWYAEAGLRVFPCKPGQKVPLTRNGVKDASTDPEQVRRWWKRWPSANIALATGHGFDVIDLDGNAAQERFAGLTVAERIEGACFGKVSTPREGGQHVYVPSSGEGNGTKTGGSLIDYRGRGGYVVAPPSVTPVGRYKWLGGPSLPTTDGPPDAEVPRWRELLKAELEPERRRAPADDTTGPPALDSPGWIEQQIERVQSLPPAPERIQPTDETLAYARAAIAGELAKLGALARPWREGAGWDDTTFRVACNLTELANASWTGYTLKNVEDDLVAHAPTDHVWTVDEIYKKARSARETVNGKERELPASLSPAVTEVPAESFGLVDGEPTREGEEAAEPFHERSLIDWDELMTGEPPEEEWIAYPLIPARRAIALYSPPKAGKSLLVLELAVAIATGGTIFGEPTIQNRVLYIDFENDPYGDIRPRLESMETDWPLLKGQLFYASFPSMEALNTPEGGARLMRLVDEYGPGVVIIDTVSRAVNGEENSNDTWNDYYRRTGVQLKRAGVACLRLDHTGKNLAKGMRGGSAKYGDVDAVWSLSVKTPSPTEPVINLECTDKRFQLDETELLLRRTTEPLRHERMYSVSKVDWLVTQMDRLDIPLDYGRRKIKPILKGAGISYRNDDLTLAIKRRKSGPKWSGTRLPKSGARDTFETCPAESGTHPTDSRSEGGLGHVWDTLGHTPPGPVLGGVSRPAPPYRAGHTGDPALPAPESVAESGRESGDSRPPIGEPDEELSAGPMTKPEAEPGNEPDEEPEAGGEIS